MTDEKDPGQESVKSDSSGDEPIIELTEEVVVDTKADNDQPELTENLIDDPQQAIEDDKTQQVEEDEDIIALDAADESDLQEDEEIVDLVDQVAQDQDDLSEDQPVTSENGASPVAEQSETGDLTGQYDLNTLDDGEVTEQYDLNALDGGEVTEQFDLNTLDDGEVTEQFDLNTLDGEEVTEQFDLNTLDGGEVTEQFDLNTLDDEEVTGQFDLNTLDDKEVTQQFDLNTLDDEEVTQQFDLNTLDDEEVTRQSYLNTLDGGEVTEQFDLNTLDDEEVTSQFDLNTLDGEEVTGQYDLKAFDDGEVTEQYDLRAFEENDSITTGDSQDETDENFGATADDDAAAAQKNETGDVTGQRDLKAFDQDDTIIVDNSRDVVDEDFGAVADDETAAAHQDEDVFDLEEEIDLAYELDDDEDEPIVLKDERNEDNQDFVDLMLGGSDESDQHDDDEPDEYFEFETEEQADIIELDADRDQVAETAALAADETTDYSDNDDLPDLEAIGGFDFGDDEEEEDGLAPDEPVADSSDDIIARSVEQSLGENNHSEPVELVDESEFGELEDDAIMDLDDAADDDEMVLALADEGPLVPEDREGLLDLNGGANLEADDEIIPMDDFDDLDEDDGDDIVEITDFDQHFPADNEAMLKQSGILDAPDDDEEDFLELIDIKEDALSDDETLVDFNEVADKTQESEIDKINQFFGDDLEADRPKTIPPKFTFNDDPENVLMKDEAAESIFGDTDASKFRLGDELPPVAEKTSDSSPDPTINAETPGSEVEEFDFDIDHRSIAQQVDRLDTFLSEGAAEEPDLAALPDDEAAEEQAFSLDSSQTGQGLAGLPAVPAGQINTAIERVINEKFSAKIEGIIYEVIEKAVAKEIDRLKGSLLGKNSIEDYED